VFLGIAAIGVNVLEDFTSLENFVTDNNAIWKLQDGRRITYRQDFSYNKAQWDQPRIAILSGPHKTASTTIQTFFSDICGSTTYLYDETSRITQKPNQNIPNATRSFCPRNKQCLHTPNPTIGNWVWPIGVKEEYNHIFNGMDGHSKFYAPLASVVSNRRRSFYIRPKQRDGKNMDRGILAVYQYFQSLFKRQWNEGKNIVIGAEAFDTFVMRLQRDSTKSGGGNQTHISLKSVGMVEEFLNVFPWDANDDGKQRPPLQRQDIEVQINLRTPRISHVASIWHQLGRKATLQQFLVQGGNGFLYQADSLGLAMQYLQNNVRVTIIDMKGVSEKESLAEIDDTSDDNGNDKETIVGGLQGVVACDILRMGKDNPGVCDSQSRLHLKAFQHPVTDQNLKPDKSVRDLTDDQMEAVDRAFDAYDCGVWQHLKHYQAKGTLRILYPSRDLFSSCNPNGSRDISLNELAAMIQEIASPK